jgi:hypothetical protein
MEFNFSHYLLLLQKSRKRGHPSIVYDSSVGAADATGVVFKALHLFISPPPPPPLYFHSRTREVQLVSQCERLKIHQYLQP